MGVRQEHGSELGHLDFAFMRYHWHSVFGGEGDFPDAEIILLHGVRFSVPVVCFLASIADVDYDSLTEITDKVSFNRTGCPFSVDNIAVFLDVESEFFVPLYPLSKFITHVKEMHEPC